MVVVEGGGGGVSHPVPCRAAADGAAWHACSMNVLSWFGVDGGETKVEAETGLGAVTVVVDGTTRGLLFSQTSFVLSVHLLVVGVLRVGK